MPGRTAATAAIARMPAASLLAASQSHTHTHTHSLSSSLSLSLMSALAVIAVIAAITAAAGAAAALPAAAQSVYLTLAYCPDLRSLHFPSTSPFPPFESPEASQS